MTETYGKVFKVTTVWGNVWSGKSHAAVVIQLKYICVTPNELSVVHAVTKTNPLMIIVDDSLVTQSTCLMDPGNFRCPVNCVSFHPLDESVVTGCWDAALYIWDISLRKRKAVSRTWRVSWKDGGRRERGTRATGGDGREEKGRG